MFEPDVVAVVGHVLYHIYQIISLGLYFCSAPKIVHNLNVDQLFDYRMIEHAVWKDLLSDSA